MKTRKSKYYRLSFLCVLNLVIYTLTFLGLSALFGSLSANRLLYAFPVMSDVVAYQSDLKQDAYERLPLERWPEAYLVVFDAKGELVFSSGQEAQEKIHFQDLPFIYAYDDSRWINVSRFRNDDGKLRYLVDQVDENGASLAYALLDEKYQVISGDLFEVGMVLDQRKMNLLQGRASSAMTIEQYTYETQNGQQRSLVFMAPAYSEERYTRLLLENQQIRLMLAPIFLIVVVLQIWLFGRMIKRSFQPLHQAIRTYQKTNVFDINMEKIPLELRETVVCLDEAIETRRQALEQREKSESDRLRMMGALSHDLKTPLTVIRGFSAALLENHVSPDKQKQYLATIHSRAILANDLINTLFDYTRLHHPDFQAKLVEVDLGEWLRQYLAGRYQEIEQAGFLLEPDLPEQPLLASIDVQMMTRIMDNLLTNTLKYCPEGTHIWISLTQKDEKLELRVANDGGEVDEKLLAEIFQPFTMGKQARSHGEGSGLGLSIVQKMVTHQNGTIEAYNQQGSFVISIHFVNCPKDS